jgi:hypothetical protein
VLEIGNTLVSADLLERKFVCDLEKCRGACCVEGDSGAPLEKDELQILDKIYNKVEPYLTAEGKASIKKYGKYVVDPDDGEYVTPLVNGDMECAYTIFEKGVAKCGIEKAYEEGKISFRKPISCHLYPIRIARLKNHEALNYHRWELCKAACALGKKVDVPVYRFLKEPLIRKYGKKWFQELELAAIEYENYRGKKIKSE